MPDRTCSLDGCDRKHFARAMCHMHYFRNRRNGDPLLLKGQTQGRGEDHANWIGDRVTYIGAHFRVKRERGLAALHDCVDCGGPATEWSYNHQDPHELHDERRDCAYSANVEFYDPRCKRCHNAFDLCDERERTPDGRYAAASA